MAVIRWRDFGLSRLVFEPQQILLPLSGKRDTQPFFSQTGKQKFCGAFWQTKHKLILAFPESSSSACFAASKQNTDVGCFSLNEKI